MTIAMADNAWTFAVLWFVACPFATCVILQSKQIPANGATVLGAVLLGGIGPLWAITQKRRSP